MPSFVYSYLFVDQVQARERERKRRPKLGSKTNIKEEKPEERKRRRISTDERVSLICLVGPHRQLGLV